MLVRCRLPARVGLSGALLSAVLLPASAAAVRSASTEHVTVTSATTQASWKQGWLRPGAAVHFTGTVKAPSSLAATLRPLDRPGIVTARSSFAVAQAGPFSGRVRLPPRALPGRYSLRVSGTSGTATLAPTQVIVTIPAPPEGVLDRVEVGTAPNGPWLTYKGGSPPVVHGSHNSLWMQYRFLYPPSGHDVEVVWKLHWHKLVGKVYKRYKDVLETTVGSGSPLPSGHWSTLLKIDGRVAKKMDVVVG
jgi:hypothetical protein